MPRLVDIFEALRPIQDPAVDVALAEALPTAGDFAVGLIAATLLERGTAEGVGALISAYHQLPANLQESLHEQAPALISGLRHAIERPEPQAAMNALRIIRQAGRADLADLVADALRFAHPDARPEAADALLHLTHQVTYGRTISEADTPEQLRGLDRVTAALGTALVHYRQHNQPTVLLAVFLVLPRHLPAVTSELDNLRNPAVDAMRRLLVNPSHETIRRSLLSLITVPALTEAATRGLIRVALTSGLADLLDMSHLLLDRRVTQAVRRIRRAHGCDLTPEPQQLSGLTEAQRQGVFRWLTTLQSESAARVQIVHRLATSEDRMTRLVALRHLMTASEQGGPEANDFFEAVASLCDDADPLIARIALRHLLRAKCDGLRRVLAKQVNSPHAELRTLAGEAIKPLGFGKFWEAWPRLQPAQRWAAGRALMKIDAEFARQLAAKLLTPLPTTRLRALAIIHGLGLASIFEKSLVAMSSDADRTVAASALKSLNGLSTPATRAAMEQALAHSDPRVRANAVDALRHADAAGPLADRLMVIAHTDENRPRANALMALLPHRRAEASAELVAMLADPRPRHRISALWVCVAANLQELARPIAHMALQEPDPGVKTRAARAVQALLQLKLRASGPAEHAPADSRAASA